MAADLVVLTGAGVSAESGLRTFRAADGLWEDHRIEDVATPAGFAADPALVQRFYDERRARLRQVEPNAAHQALAEAARGWPGTFTLVTQNIDDLHERAGSPAVLHMHGELLKARCTACDHVGAAPATIPPGTACPACGRGRLRPHVVWFGEVPLHLDAVTAALSACDLFIAAGTSGTVHPAAGFVEIARGAGARCIEANLDATTASPRFHERRLGKAGAVMGPLLAELRAAAA